MTRAGTQAVSFGPIASDPGGTSWALGNYIQLTPVAIASLTPCGAANARTLAVINSGVASSAYNARVGTTTGTATVPVFCNGG
jgi:hypothetical protein